MERTLIVFKPDAVQRGVVGEILTRFERTGLKLIGMKMAQPDEGHYQGHYEAIGKVATRHGQKVYDDTVEMMMTGPVIAAVLEGVEAVELVRKMVGATEPKSAAAGTIRGDYAHVSYGHADGMGIGIYNLIHASGDSAEAKQEIAHWFRDDELFDYETAHERHTQPRKHPRDYAAN